MAGGMTGDPERLRDLAKWIESDGMDVNAEMLRRVADKLEKAEAQLLGIAKLAADLMQDTDGSGQ